VHGRTADLFDEKPGDGERLVADELRLEAVARSPCKQAIVGIPLREAGVIRDDWRYAAEVTISRIIALTSQPVRTNSVASQSSSSGCEGRSPCVPKSSAVFTSPTPKTVCQYRLTATRAVSGWSGRTSHFARSSRVSRG